MTDVRLADKVAVGFRLADGVSMGVLLVVALLLVPAFVLSLLVKEIPLRSEGGLVAARADSDGEAARAKGEAESAIVV